MAKQVWLFDPRTAERKLTDLNMVAGITGRTVKSVRSSIGRRIKCLNCYLLELDTPLSKFRELLAKEVIEDEVWRDIPNSLWQVSSYGRYRSYLRCQPDRFVYRLPRRARKNSSQNIKIIIGGCTKLCVAHEWVYKLFIGEVPKGYVIYHLSGDKFDNRVGNLGVIKRSELVVKQCTPANAIEVQQLDMNTGEVLAEYSTLTQAAKVNYTDIKSIREAARKGKPSIGFRWKISKEKSII